MEGQRIVAEVIVIVRITAVVSIPCLVESAVAVSLPPEECIAGPRGVIRLSCPLGNSYIVAHYISLFVNEVTVVALRGQTGLTIVIGNIVLRALRPIVRSKVCPGSTGANVVLDDRVPRPLGIQSYIILGHREDVVGVVLEPLSIRLGIPTGKLH